MRKRTALLFTALSAAALCLGGCGSKADFMKPFDAASNQSEFSFVDTAEEDRAVSFAADLCVVGEDVMPAAVPITSQTASIYCVDDNKVLYAKNVHEKLNPASLTKVMTAILALESGRLEDVVTITEEAMITESGATVCDLKPGDQLTLRQLLNCALVRSGNDAASAIAIHLGQSIDGFCEMMNARAVELGATNTSFLNPHGLTQEGHYTTAYDIYLILQEAMEYEEFLTIINQSSYEMTYRDAEGNEKTNSFESTNRYLNGRADAPDGVTVIGGKTGTTNAAGSCLALVSRSSSQKQYISVILKADSTDVVFEEMSALLSLEN